MKMLRLFFLLFLMVFIFSCSSVYDVQFDYDTKADFSNLKTYDWLPIPDKADIDSLTAQRIKNAVNTQLEAKGLKMTSGQRIRCASRIGAIAMRLMEGIGPDTGALGVWTFTSMKKDHSSWILSMLNQKI